MPAFQVRMLGRLDTQRDQRPLAGLGSLKVQELLCYLLLHRDRPDAREGLAGQIWGDIAPAQARKYLRQALWQLKSALDPEGAPASADLLLVNADWVRINPEGVLWLDLAELEHAFTLTHHTPGAELAGPVARSIQQAVELYQGDLLEGWYQDWCIYKRERLQNMYLSLLDKLMDHSEAHAEFEAGLAYGRRILRYDRARERTHRRMMRLHYLAGDRSSALRQYERCAVALQEELGVKPARLTGDLHEQIRADDLDAAKPCSVAGRAPFLNSARTDELTRHLEQFQENLLDLQARIQTDIRTLEQLLGDGF